MIGKIAANWFEQVWNARNLDAIQELTLKNVTGRLEGGMGFAGLDQFLEFREAFLAAVPNLHVEVLKVISEDDHACVYWQATGNHTGHGMGLQPTGDPVDFRGATWFQFEGQKIAKAWDCWNQGALMQAMSKGTVRE